MGIMSDIDIMIQNNPGLELKHLFWATQKTEEKVDDHK